MSTPHFKSLLSVIKCQKWQEMFDCDSFGPAGIRASAKRENINARTGYDYEEILSLGRWIFSPFLGNFGLDVSFEVKGLKIEIE